MEISKNDIPIEIACDAFRWSSMSPEKRGEQVQTEYVEIMTNFYNQLMTQARNDQEREYLEAEALRYKTRYLQYELEYLRARGRCASVLVTGGSNFNVRRNEKANNAERNKSNEFLEWQTRARRAILRSLEKMRTAEAGGPLVVLKQDIEAAEKTSELYKTIRARFRKEHDNGRRVEILKELTGLSGEKLLEFVRENGIDADGLPAFRLTNNNARIRAMRERLAQLEKQESTPTSEKTFQGGHVVDNAEADRIQIFFDERPDAKLCTKLKGRGFRWSPSSGAWQRYRTANTRWAVKKITGVEL